MSAHTPGPWQLKPEVAETAYLKVRGTLLGRRYKIANVMTPTYEGAHEIEVQETIANARLIAAAPDLLEELIKARGCLTTALQEPISPLGREIIERRIASASAAISKAKGAA